MKENKKSVRKRRKRSPAAAAGIFMVILLAVLVLLGLLVLGGYIRMEKRGKSSLAVKQAALPTQMGAVPAVEESAEPAEEEALEEGAVRYQGRTYLYKKDILTFLCMGIDKRGEMQATSDLHRGGQADAIFLVVLDRKLQKVSVIAVNRDTMTAVSVYDKEGNYTGEQIQQLALSHAYGDGMEESCERTVEAVSHLFYGLPIHGYCALNMEVISIINDAVGGVRLVPKEDVVIKGTVRWKAGEEIYLDGEDAFSFVQNRDISIAQSAEERLGRQKQYIQALAAQAKAAMKQDMTLPIRIYSGVTPYMVTDISSDEVLYLAGEILSYRFDGGDMYTLQGRVEQGELFEEFYPDETALYELILSIFYEEKRTNP